MEQIMQVALGLWLPDELIRNHGISIIFACSEYTRNPESNARVLC